MTTAKANFTPRLGDLMTLDEFINDVESGMFIDYDGFGCYATMDEETKIMVRPSDLKRGLIKKEYPLIVWFNR